MKVRHTSVKIVGLEGAVMVCLDIANGLVRENFAKIVFVDTSYDEVTTKVQQVPKQRAGISILLEFI